MTGSPRRHACEVQMLVRCLRCNIIVQFEHKHYSDPTPGAG